MELIVERQANMQADETCEGDESPSPGFEHIQSIELPERPRKVLKTPGLEHSGVLNLWMLQRSGTAPYHHLL